ncbi:hypothetical protein [Shewanella surugensis]|uniref:Uncharacterized protein n=1 Tax=Shewanella surugensis TaxID=212020 RepID=A0ABT0L7D4_9GAMM|nr:hypothetical protein [Shewanella surugensis]MCL1123295.1 hypothetical protein [Shewanella surugensis]
MALSRALNDLSRSQRPEKFNALLLYVSSKSAGNLVSSLTAMNAYCPLSVFLEAARFAASLAMLDLDKIQRGLACCQSLEWRHIAEPRALLPLSQQYNDVGLSQVDDAGKSLISDIDAALNELDELKSARDARLTQTAFTPANHGLFIEQFNASSARGLAEQVKARGDNNEHWVQCLFVGDAGELSQLMSIFG